MDAFFGCRVEFEFDRRMPLSLLFASTSTSSSSSFAPPRPACFESQPPPIAHGQRKTCIYTHPKSHSITKKTKNSARRARLGLLEKKSDYRARAADFHKKEATLKSLARKAEARNPDEFYFGMHKARTEKGVAVVE